MSITVRKDHYYKNRGGRIVGPAQTETEGEVAFVKDGEGGYHVFADTGTIWGDDKNETLWDLVMDLGSGPVQAPQIKNEPALRFDAEKSRVDLIPPEFIEELGRHYGIGARKYAERNWEKGMSWSRCYSSAQRHMLAFWQGEDIDAETGTPHVIAAAWNMAALHWYAVHGRGTDDRPVYDAVQAAAE